LWRPLHWRHQRQVCRPLSSRRRGTSVHHWCFNLLRGCRSRQTLRCCCSHWPVHNERGGKLLQHRVERDDPCGRSRARTQCQCQRIWLKEAKYSSRRSGVVSRRAPADVPRRLTPSAAAATSAVGAPPPWPLVRPHPSSVDRHVAPRRPEGRHEESVMAGCHPSSPTSQAWAACSPWGGGGSRGSAGNIVVTGKLRHGASRRDS